jgi:photosystem II stability/assembly factor-like uncharacterized protein
VKAIARALTLAAALAAFFISASAAAQAAKPTAAAAAPKAQPTLDELFEGVKFRSIGPYRGGRVTAVSGLRGQPLVYYQGATGGGVWKTTDAGSNWRAVSDKDFKTGSVGAIGVAESDPNVVYVGMGECPIRGNVSHGDGVYKTTDGGKTWKNVGLADTRQICRLRVHPQNPDLVYVAALGHVWGPNADRGIFRSKDGGKSWQKVLFVSENTGASDLVMDPSNPRVLYAGFWQVRRRPWELVSGGPEGGVWKTADGGDTWKKLEGGLPEEVVGKIGVAISPARSDRVWALVESREKGGVYRTDDAGETWTRVNSENKLRQRAWYYTRLYADPKNADSLYVLNVQFHRSVDGGKTFSSIRVPHGDNHDLWIDPDDPQRMIESNDGGANVSFDGGRSWSSIFNQPTGQFYRVTTDDGKPYRVYGSQQDNTTISIASRSTGSVISANDWYPVGGCESGWIAPKPKDPDVVFAGCYGGSITRYDHRTRQDREIVAWPQLAIGQAPKDLKYRFQWNAPIVVSRHDPSVLWHASQVLLESRDEGQSWREISPDLTRNDKTKQDYSGGPITRDNTSVETYGTIFALGESPHEPGTLWAGTDDGLVHLTRDGGRNWSNVTPRGIPEWIQINAIDVSPHEKGGATIAATMYKHDDFRPYLFRTTDYGRTWKRIDAGIPDGAFTRVVREDSGRAGLLFAGTETGLYVSLDGGASWQRFQRNLPVVPITDLTVKENDLVVATQGRAFWILDDLSPLRSWKPEIGSARLHVFAPAPAYRWEGGGGPEGLPPPTAAGQNPANGVVVTYVLKEKPQEAAPLTVEILDGDTLLRTYTSKKKEKEGEDDTGDKPLEPKAGVNRVIWDMRLSRPELLPKAVIWGSSSGPKVAPGTYTVRLKMGDQTATEKIEILPNPLVAISPEDLGAQHALMKGAMAGVSESHEAVRQIREVKGQLKEIGERAERLGKGTALRDQAKALSEKLTAVEKKLVNPDIQSNQDVLNFPPALDHQFAGLASVVSSADAKPTDAAAAFYRETRAKLDAIQAELKTLWNTDLAAFNDAVRKAEIPPVTPMPKKAA